MREFCWAIFRDIITRDYEGKNMDIIKDLIERIRDKNLTIVFPEGEDIRVLGAAVRLKKDNVLTPIILGDVDLINKIASEKGFDLSGISLINPKTAENFDYYVEKFVACRDGKNTVEQARDLLRDENYFGTMMVYLGEADGMVSGAIHATADSIRPSLQIIKTRTGVSRASGSILMVGPNGERYVYADIAINTAMNPQLLAEIAVESARTARVFDIDPKVAMLSFSTNGSAVSDDTKRTIEATEIAKKLAPNLAIDGEMQFDAAVVKSIAKAKMPDSEVAGKANVFIFPDIQSGNIAYKITQYLGGFKAYGPLIQGLNKPVNDLSRGCSEDDVYGIAVITAAQSLDN